MDTNNLRELEMSAPTVSEILRTKYNWSHLAFVDGMAPISRRNGKNVWKPKITFLKQLVGGSNGRPAEIDSVVKEGTLLKFILPNKSTQESADYQNWRGYIDREAVYSDESAGYVLERWVRFSTFNNQGMQFTVEYLDRPVEVYLPTILFFGAEWIKVAPSVADA